MSTTPIAVSESLTVVAFMKDGSSAPSARLADYVMLHWSYNNLTGVDQKLSFPKGQIFELSLLKLDGTLIGKPFSQVAGADLNVVVPNNGSFDIPADSENDQSRIPKIPLADMIAKYKIPPSDELVVRLVPLVNGDSGYDRHDRYLWR